MTKWHVSEDLYLEHGRIGIWLCSKADETSIMIIPEEIDDLIMALGRITWGRRPTPVSAGDYDVLRAED
jgi:hypothetical protein